MDQCGSAEYTKTDTELIKALDKLSLAELEAFQNGKSMPLGRYQAWRNTIDYLVFWQSPTIRFKAVDLCLGFYSNPKSIIATGKTRGFNKDGTVVPESLRKGDGKGWNQSLARFLPTISDEQYKLLPETRGRDLGHFSRTNVSMVRRVAFIYLYWADNSIGFKGFTALKSKLHLNHGFLSCPDVIPGLKEETNRIFQAHRLQFLSEREYWDTSEVMDLVNNTHMPMVYDVTTSAEEKQEEAMDSDNEERKVQPTSLTTSSKPTSKNSSKKKTGVG